MATNERRSFDERRNGETLNARSNITESEREKNERRSFDQTVYRKRKRKFEKETKDPKPYFAKESTKKRVNKATNAYGDDRCQGNDETKEVVWATCHLT